MDHSKAKRFLFFSLIAFGCLTILFIMAALALMTVGRSDVLVAFSAAGSMETPEFSGYAYLGAGISTGLAAIGAGIGVGIAGSAAIGAISENPQLLGRALIFIALAEGVAIYGLIISIMIIGRL